MQFQTSTIPAVALASSAAEAGFYASCLASLAFLLFGRFRLLPVEAGLTVLAIFAYLLVAVYYYPFGVTSVLRIVQVTFCMLFFYLNAATAENGTFNAPLVKWLAVMLLLALLFQPLLNRVGLSLFINTNLHGITAIAAGGVALVARNLSQEAGRRGVFMIAALVVANVAISGSRTSLVALFCAGIIAVLWSRVYLRPLKANALLLFALLPAVFLAAATLTPIGRQVNEVVMELTGKNLLSGRNRIWPGLLDAWSNSSFIGYGFDPRTIFGVTGELAHINGQILSAHNWFIQSLFQVGLIGTLPIIALLWMIWRRIVRIRDVGLSASAASLFAATLVVQTFEVTLTQTTVANGLLFWGAAGYAIGHGWRH